MKFSFKREFTISFAIQDESYCCDCGNADKREVARYDKMEDAILFCEGKADCVIEVKYLAETKQQK